MLTTLSRLLELRSPALPGFLERRLDSDKRLRATPLSRRERGLNIPYGAPAWALGLVPDPEVPPPLIRKKKT
jgi:hypothetical protein